MVTPYLTLFYCSKKAAETSWTGISPLVSRMGGFYMGSAHIGGLLCSSQYQYQCAENRARRQHRCIIETVYVSVCSQVLCTNCVPSLDRSDRNLRPLGRRRNACAEKRRWSSVCLHWLISQGRKHQNSCKTHNTNLRCVMVGI